MLLLASASCRCSKADGAETLQGPGSPIGTCSAWEVTCSWPPVASSTAAIFFFRPSSSAVMLQVVLLEGRGVDLDDSALHQRVCPHLHTLPLGVLRC